MGCRLWGHTESDTTEATQQQQPQQFIFLSSFRLAEKIKPQVQRVPKYPFKVAEFPVLLTSCITVAPLLQLMNQH